MSNENKGFYKLNWMQRIGFGSGDLAQNLIYQTISIWLAFFYTNVFGLPAGYASVMFLVVRIIDVIWDPIVGAYIDKHSPKLGKYRAYLVFGGIPLVGFAILCFWNGMSDASETAKLIYAYVTYVGMSMCYTLVNVPYGALNASLTRDTNEITILTSTRMFMANLGGLLVSAGIPIFVCLMTGYGDIHNALSTALFMGLGSLPAFIFMPLVPAIKRKVGKRGMFNIFLSVAIVGMVLLYIVGLTDLRKNDLIINVCQFIKSTGVIVATGYMWALVPEVISYSEYTSGKRISGIVNALTGIFFKAGMALGGFVPLFVLWITDYKPGESAGQDGTTDPQAWFTTMLIYGLVALALLIFCFTQCKERVVMDEKETANVKVSDLWMEFIHNRPLRILAFFFITAFAMMSVGNAGGPYFMAERTNDTISSFQWQGILWLLCLIPAILLFLAMWIISKYELTDEKMDEINHEIEAKAAAKE